MERTAPLEFEAFFERESGRLFQTMYLATGNRAEAEDLTQEALARAFERWGRIRTMASPAGYVYQTAFNLHRKLIRRRERAAPAPTPEASPESITELRDEILRALRTLPASQLHALLLVEWTGMTAEEAAGVLGVEAVSVRGRIHRARATLRERFGRDDG